MYDHIICVSQNLFGLHFVKLTNGILNNFEDEAGDPIDQGLAATNEEGKAMIDIAINTAYIDFAIGGSDGFDPVFFQPFDFIYNITHSFNDVIQIPVKSWKNVIVSVKDCFTGEAVKTRALVKFPEYAASPHSWYDRQLMPNRHSAFADDQGMAFFQLEPDVMVPIEVQASGYETYHSRIGIASNVTHLVSADLCKKVIFIYTYRQSLYKTSRFQYFSCSSNVSTGIPCNS